MICWGAINVSDRAGLLVSHSEPQQNLRQITWTRVFHLVVSFKKSASVQAVVFSVEV